MDGIFRPQMRKKTLQGVSNAALERLAVIAVEQIRHMVLELYPISQAVVDVDERALNFTFQIAPELCGSDIYFPVPIAGRAGVDTRRCTGQAVPRVDLAVDQNEIGVLLVDLCERRDAGYETRDAGARQAHEASAVQALSCHGSSPFA